MPTIAESNPTLGSGAPGTGLLLGAGLALRQERDLQLGLELVCGTATC